MFILRIIILGLFWRGKALAHVSGQAEPGGDTSEGDAGRDHCAHHDHPHLQHQRLPSQDILRQIDRRLLSFLLFHGLCQPDRWVGIRSKQHEVCCRRSSRWKHISLRPLATKPLPLHIISASPHLCALLPAKYIYNRFCPHQCNKMTASPINASKRLDLPATKTLKSVNGKYFLVMLLYPSCNKLCVPYVHPAVEASLRKTSRVPCFIDHHHW